MTEQKKHVQKRAPEEILPPEEEKPKRAATVSVGYSGPIPPPSMLAKYDELMPGSANRIMKMAERSQRSMNIARKEEMKYLHKGQDRGFIIALVSLGASTLLAFGGHDVVAGVIGGTTAVGLVGSLVIGALKR